MKKRIFFLLIVLFVLGLQFAYANVIVFSNYQTKAELRENNTLHIIKELTLKNVGQAPIIPGELHFRMYEKDSKGELGSKITSYGATGHYNNILSVSKFDYPSQTELVIDIWEPILPGFIYTFKVEYDINFKPKGILFYDISLPDETTTIPIENNIYELTIPKNKHITYTVGGKVSDGRVVWTNIESPVVEYSILPLPRMPVPGVNVFWFSVIIILALLLVGKIMKRSSR